MFSVTTPLQVKNNPSNTSTSKHHWSFTKSGRFPSPKSNCNKMSYDKKSCLSERRASIGVGDRTKYFDGVREIPEPGKYEMESHFQQQKRTRKGFSFSSNRQNLKFDNYQKTSQATPSPSMYKQDSPQIKQSLFYTMRPKTSYPSNCNQLIHNSDFLPNKTTLTLNQKLPGPGKYQTIDSLGNKYYTKSSNYYARSFSGSQRFRGEGPVTPGPLDYYVERTIQPDGIYLLSNMKGTGRRAFMNGKRNLKVDGNKETPGPGSYRQPSDFGHYEQPIEAFVANHDNAIQKRPSTALA